MVTLCKLDTGLNTEIEVVCADPTPAELVLRQRDSAGEMVVEVNCLLSAHECLALAAVLTLCAREDR